MSGLFVITVLEARGFVATLAEIDRLAVVMGSSSLGSGLSPFFRSGQAAQAAVGYGDAPDTLCQIIEQVQDNGGGAKYPAAMYTTPNTTAGAYGTINVTGVTGTSVVTFDNSVKPFGTYEARLRVTLGGTVATGPISLVYSLDGGRTESQVVALGTANTYTIPNSNVKFNFAAGTLVTGDIVSVRTTAPAPTAGDITTAMAALAVSTIDFSILVCEFPMTAALAGTVKTGLAALRAVGKRVTALSRTRMRNFESAETEAAWYGVITADFTSAFVDSSQCVRAAYGFVGDAMTGRQYLRSDLAQWAADVVRIPRARLPNVPFDQREANFTLVDPSGATIGHDEGTRGSVTGLSDDSLGNRFSSVQRLPDAGRREDVFSTVPWVMYAADERIRNLAVRRLANAIERTAVTAGTSVLGENLFYITDPDGSNPRLTPASRNAVHGTIWAALKKEFPGEIQNLLDGDNDTGLVQVNPAITITGGNLVNVACTLSPRIPGFLLTLAITLAVQE